MLIEKISIWQRIFVQYLYCLKDSSKLHLFEQKWSKGKNKSYELHAQDTTAGGGNLTQTCNARAIVYTN